VAIVCRLYRHGEIAEERFDPAKVSDALQEDGTLVWLDVEDPTEDDLRMLQEEFSLHRVAMDAIRERNQRPRVDLIGDVFFVAAYAFALENSLPMPQEVHAIVSPRYLVTLRYSPTFDLSHALRRWEQDGERTTEGAGFLLHALLDEIVDSYFMVIDDFELAAEEIEGKVFSDKLPANIQKVIYEQKSELFEFRRRILPLREVLDLLQEERELVTKTLRPDYKDLGDNVARVLELIEAVRELLNSAVNAHLSIASHELNEVMKKLTSWAAIILLPTLIAGIYGMNFRHMPELDWRWGYPFSLGLMLVSAGLLYVMFKRRRWL
jgi:magnesium transporter